MEWVLVALVVWLASALRRERRRHRADRRRRGRRDGPFREAVLADGRAVLRVEGSLFTPEVDGGDRDEEWRWVALEDCEAAQQQHDSTVTEVRAGSSVAGGGRPGSSDDVEVEAFPVLLLPVGRRRVAAVDVYATGGRLGRLPAVEVDRHGDALVEVARVEGRPAGVEARILRGPDGGRLTEVLLPERFEATPPR